MMKVAKFGGTSLADAIQIKKIKEIVHNDKDIICIVPSAPGKRFTGDIKITDMLYEFYNISLLDLENAIAYFQRIKERYNSIISELSMDLDLESEYEIIIENMKTNHKKDYIMSRGEYLSGKILAKYLSFTFYDPWEYIYFNEYGCLDEDKTYNLLSDLKYEKNMVIPGFYGCDINGDIKIFPRGGSDITGAIVSRGLDVDVYENWTDVSGIYIIDPKIIKSPYVRKNITYKEMLHQSSMGANVYHKDAIYPVMEHNIPIHIRNTNEPYGDGTIICNSIQETDQYPLLAITGKNDFDIYLKNAQLSIMSWEKRIITKDFIAMDHNRHPLHKISQNHRKIRSNSLILIIANKQLDKEYIQLKISKRLEQINKDYIISYEDQEPNLYIAVDASEKDFIMKNIYTMFFSADIMARG